MIIETINGLLDPIFSVFDSVENSVSMTAPTGILLFGLATGLRHSFETDHVAAVVSLVASSKKNIKRASLLGAAWGLGHTVSLFVTGLLVLLLAITIPESVNDKLEFGVGVMLLFLSITTFTGFSIGRFLKGLRGGSHSHLHSHENIVHSHEHDHEKDHAHTHRSLIVGMVHGTAGSGALMLVVLSTINSVPLGLAFIAIFGAGSIAGMAAASTLIGLPFAKSKNVKIVLALRYVAAATTLIIGAELIYNLVWIDHIFMQ